MTASSSKAQKLPTLIFSPGAWHTAASFSPTISILESQESFKCLPLNLPSIGSELRNEPPPQSWDADVSHIRSAILSELDAEDGGRDVVLVVHSYSGTVGSEACKGLDKESRRGEGRGTCVTALVYLSAIVLEVGGWIWEATGGKPVDESRTIMKGDLCYPANTTDWFYNECDPSLLSTLESQLQSHAWKSFFSKVTYAAWRDIPSWYLHCTNDGAVPLEAQKAMISYGGGKWKTQTCDADHSPMISRVGDVVGIIKAAVAEGAGSGES